MLDLVGNPEDRFFTTKLIFTYFGERQSDIACVRDSPSGTTGSFINGTIGDRFSATKDTIGANVTIGGNVGTIGSPNGTIGKPTGVNSNIMINTSNLFLYSYFLCVYFSISIIC